MESLPLHPRIVHLPIALSVLMPLVASGLLLAWWREWLPKRGWLLAIALQGALSVSAFIAMETGEEEEERVEKVLANESTLEAHEEAAEVFLWASIGVLVLFAAALAVPKHGFKVGALATVATVAVLGLGYRVGHAGGQLVYKEGAAAAYTTAQTAGERPAVAGGEADEDSDDD